MKIIKGSINTVPGYKAASVHVGIKKSRNDLLVIFSEKKAHAYAMFTRNKVRGAPLIVSMNHLKNQKAQAIIVNSGISNVATGEKGIQDAYLTTKLAAKELGINQKDVLVSSTGIIGKYLPMEKIKIGLKNIKNKLTRDPHNICDAILTTDTKKKEIVVKEGNFTIGAIAKGSGMIHPNLATMLCFIATDALISPIKLKTFLRDSVHKSFNMVNVDQDTSTSDSIYILANGLAGNVNDKKFKNALDFVCIKLAKMIAKDGEGATKLIEVLVKNAKTMTDAEKIAKGIVSSNLVKAAFFGNDLNWGRIICAIGNSKSHFNEQKIDVSFNGEKIVHKGVENNFNRNNALNALKKDEVKVTIDLHDGNKNATAWGCDLSYDYVKINAEYHT